MSETLDEFIKGRDNFYQNTKHLLDESIQIGSLSSEELELKYKKYDITGLTFAPDITLQTSVQQQIKNFHNLINKTLDEYFQFRYSVSNEQMMKVVNNVNNFKLKHNNFQIISEQYNGKSYYYDRAFLFMTVDSVDLTVTTHW
ncbi:hypothetical protein VPHK460_0290 [Vibrio phage K460]